MNCMNCGNPLRGDVRFCPKCGTPVAQQPAYTPPPEQVRTTWGSGPEAAPPRNLARR